MLAYLKPPVSSTQSALCLMMVHSLANYFTICLDNNAELTTSKIKKSSITTTVYVNVGA
jgi:hypothetical protein